MGNVMAYSGLTTKIRAMQAKLLTQADYETISGFTDVVQVVEFLKTKPAYAVYMDQLELAHLHRGVLRRCCISLCIMITQESSGLRESTRRNF